MGIDMVACRRWVATFIKALHMHATGAVMLGDTQWWYTHIVNEQPSDLPAGLPGRVQGPLEPLLHFLHLLSVHSQLRSTHRLMLLGPQHSFSSSNTQRGTWYMQQVGSITLYRLVCVYIRITSYVYSSLDKSGQYVCMSHA